MTPKQRAAVVELLKCAADVDSIAIAFDRAWAPGVKFRYPGEHPVWDLAVQARIDIAVDIDTVNSRDSYKFECLEAAQRCEDGDWP